MSTLYSSSESGYNESFGLVALEARASGTPVIASRVGGLPIAVADGETGELVDGRSPEAWAEGRDIVAQLCCIDLVNNVGHANIPFQFGTEDPSGVLPNRFVPVT